MPSLGFVVRNGEIRVSQESRESPLPRGHQHRVTGAALAGVVRIKTTKSTPHICDSGKAPADKADQGLKFYRFGSAGTENLPQSPPGEGDSPSSASSHTAAAQLCTITWQRPSQEGSDCPWLSPGCSTVTLPVSSAQLCPLLLSLQQQNNPCCLHLAGPCASCSPAPHPSQCWGSAGSSPHLAAPPRGC